VGGFGKNAYEKSVGFLNCRIPNNTKPGLGIPDSICEILHPEEDVKQVT